MFKLSLWPFTDVGGFTKLKIEDCVARNCRKMTPGTVGITVSYCLIQSFYLS